MPTKPYHCNALELPRQDRFGGLMQETAVLMDNAILKFAWGKAQSGDMSGRLADAGKPDVHPWDQAIFLITGQVEVVLGDNGSEGTYLMKPMDFIYIPANVPHIGRVVGDEEAFGVDIFAPVRPDYLDMCEHQLAQEKE